MPAYLNDDELLHALRACRRLADIAVRVATVACPSDADARQLQEYAARRACGARAGRRARGSVH